jgi:uncharacterized membrane protein
MEPISKVNLERITNGIYAFTMTLLVRNIQGPLPGTGAASLSVAQYVVATAGSIIDFAGAFLILGMFWLFYFQMFHRMRSVDYRFVHLHLLSLMIVVFVPFTQSFADDRVGIPVSLVFFQFNYLALAILLLVQWRYARSKPALIEPALSLDEARFLEQKYLVPLGVSLLGILLVLSGFLYTDLLYLLPFVILGLFFRNPPGEEAPPAEVPALSPRGDDQSPPLT